MSNDVFLVVALAVLVAMMFLSSRKRKKQASDLLASIKVGSNVVLHSGITGKIVSVEGDRAVIETTPGTKIAFLKGAIRSVDSSAPKTVPAVKPAAKAAVKSSSAKKPAAAKTAAKKPAAKKTAAK
jgi:preprotein translocase subunit YajC